MKRILVSILLILSLLAVSSCKDKGKENGEDGAYIEAGKTEVTDESDSTEIDEEGNEKKELSDTESTEKENADNETDESTDTEKEDAEKEDKENTDMEEGNKPLGPVLEVITSPDRCLDFTGVYNCGEKMKLEIKRITSNAVDVELTAINDEKNAFTQFNSTLILSTISEGKATFGGRDDNNSIAAITLLFTEDERWDERAIEVTISDSEKGRGAEYYIPDGEYIFTASDMDFDLELSGCIPIERLSDVWATKDISKERGGVILSIFKEEDSYILEYRGLWPAVKEGAFTARFTLSASKSFTFNGKEYLKSQDSEKGAVLELDLKKGIYEYDGITPPDGVITLGFEKSSITFKSPFYSGELVRNGTALSDVDAGPFTVTDISDLIIPEEYLGEWEYISEKDNLASVISFTENDNVYILDVSVRRDGKTQLFTYIAPESFTFIPGGDTYISAEISEEAYLSDSSDSPILQGCPEVGFDEKFGIYANLTDVDGYKHFAQYTRVKGKSDVFERLDELSDITVKKEDSSSNDDESTENETEDISSGGLSELLSGLSEEEKAALIAMLS